MSSRSIADLNYAMKNMATAHTQLCNAKGVDLLIYCTLRPNMEQDELYAIGRTKPGKIVTNARAGESAHNPNKLGQASAYDCVPLIGGKAMWDSKHPAWTIVISCGEEVGLTASAKWLGKLKEQAHFQDPEWTKPRK